MKKHVINLMSDILQSIRHKNLDSHVENKYQGEYQMRLLRRSSMYSFLFFFTISCTSYRMPYQIVFALLVISWALLILVWSGCKLDIFPDCVGLWKPKILAVEINQYGVFYKGISETAYEDMYDMNDLRVIAKQLV